jgi:hypothetical protein
MRFRFPSSAHAQAGCVALALFAAVAASSVSRSAHADTSDQVNALFKKGVDFYKEADFRAALVEFKRAYDVSNHDYRVLYNVAQCEYQLTNYVGALNAFEKYLADGGSQIKDEKRGEVLAEIAKLKGRVGLVTFKVDPATAKLTVDGEAAAKVGEAVKLNPGSHKVEVSATGFERTTESVDVGSGDVRTVEIKLKVAASAAPPTSVTDSGPSWTGPIVGFAITGGLAVGTVVFGVLASGKSSDLVEAKKLPNPTPDSLKSLDSSVGTFALVTDVFLGATVVAAGISTYLTIRTLSDSPRGPERKLDGTPKGSVRLVPTLGGGVLVGSF